VLLGTADEVRLLVESFAQGIQGASETLVGREKEMGTEAYIAAARRVSLQTVDLFWLEHLEAMEYLRGAVNLRAYGQRDPLIEYRKEGLRLFRTMEEAVATQTAELLMRLSSAGAFNTSQPQESLLAPVSAPVAPEVGRNDPCPCDSGKKWKNCGLKNTPEHQERMAAKKF
jgi:preprotein translocase subunit SecA